MNDQEFIAAESAKAQELLNEYIAAIESAREKVVVPVTEGRLHQGSVIALVGRVAEMLSLELGMQLNILRRFEARHPECAPAVQTLIADARASLERALAEPLGGDRDAAKGAGA